MKKMIIFLMAIALCMQGSCVALGSEAPENRIVYDRPETGDLTGAAVAGDGMLLAGIPLDKETPWLALLDRNGAERWVFSETEKNVSEYLCPARLDDGTYTVLRVTYSDDAGYVYDRLSLDENGKLLGETPLRYNVHWMIPVAEGTCAIGSFSKDDRYHPWVALQDSMGKSLFSNYYTIEGCTQAGFDKGILREDALIVNGYNNGDQDNQDAALLYRIDSAGDVVWGLITKAKDPHDYVYSNDICVSDDGQIIWICTTVKGEDDGYPYERSSTVYCVNMDGEIVWKHTTSENDMLDYVVPVPGGYLFGSEGLELENCPYLGQGWLLYLTRDGQEDPDVILPQLGDGSMELLGMTANTETSVLCYGLLLEEPGFPDKPFWFALTFPQAEE